MCAGSLFFSPAPVEHDAVYIQCCTFHSCLESVGEMLLLRNPLVLLIKFSRVYTAYQKVTTTVNFKGGLYLGDFHQGCNQVMWLVAFAAFFLLLFFCYSSHLFTVTTCHLESKTEILNIFNMHYTDKKSNHTCNALF